MLSQVRLRSRGAGDVRIDAAATGHIIAGMAYGRLLLLVSLCIAAACQPRAPFSIKILDAEQVREQRGTFAVPRELLATAGVVLDPADRVYLNGYRIDPDRALPSGGNETFQIRRAMTVTVNGRAMNTAASTVGELLGEAGNEVYTSDSVSPPVDTPLTNGLAVTYEPSRQIAVTSDGTITQIRSAPQTVAASLAQAGMPILALDVSLPPEDQPLADGGGIRITRVSESLVLTDESIPYASTFQDSAQLELGTEQILQAGLPGLAVTRTRVRYEDGQEVSRQIGPRSVVRPPQQRLVSRGTRIVEKSTVVDGASIRYWHVMQMYATVYSPCESGTAGGGCSYGTASGLRAGKGVVAVDPALYAYLNGQRLYIPGYGNAVVGDVGGGYIVEHNLGISRYKWIDLGFDDNNIQDMTGWITVYFLAPVPASIPEILK